MKQKPSKFGLVLAEAVQEGLGIVGSSIPSVVFFYLKKKESIQSDQFIDDPQALDEGLKEIFGFGAKVLEKKVLEVLYVKLEVQRTIEGDFEFAEEVRKAQKLLYSTDLRLAETIDKET